ncbi:MULTISPECIES: peptidoglycan DD-metalloendopeptidase family protein [Colwellia]|uniref:Family M23 zinc metallopeptidase with OapA domain protein n=1 Tax=Colwellia marinimaniae TaxID=1513592 RepID=A0ABQ0MZ03_9GAMM|nr:MULTISPECIES: peptidoglycan DD-metalloendopeptidase family protein [Colwellia]GAW97492.1 family M23 zinc metallopeptidase with OapA domain protein [Colwellia marinimaniae]
MLKKLLETFQNLPKQHRWIIIGSSCFLLFLLIFPSSDDSDNSKDIPVGQRIQLTLPEDIVPASTTPRQSALPQRSLAKVTYNSATEQLPSLAKNQSTQQDGSLASGELSGKVKIQDSIAELANLSWQTVQVRSGDSLALILKRLGFSAQTTYAVSTAKGKDSKLLKRLNVGDKLRIASNESQQLAALEYPLSRIETLFINLVGDGYQSHRETKQVEIRESFSYGTIRSSFWNAGITAGLSDSQIINFANIFGWDIDFGLDIRAGDSFHITYEKKYVEGEYIGTGNILAAEITNQGEVFQAIRFTDDEYYSPDGRSMRKAFLRAPVNFKYISSSFKRNRRHPVTKRLQAHNGIDYAAKKGTPVVAAGNGKVIRAGYSKYNGYYVFIQHGNGIVTKYLHFYKRAAVKKGQRVKQGQVIGYVGATGLAAGPHLHYEFLLHGVHRNPRTVKLPDARPIAKKYKAKFTLLAAERLAALSGAKNALLSTQVSDITPNE